MRRRQRNSQLIADINITPFTDVILVLLIIFMITTPFIYRSSIKIALPKVSGNQRPLMRTKDIDVSITSAGEVYLNNERYNLKLDLDLFKFKLRQLMKRYNNPALIIDGDRNVKYDYVVQVIDAASKVGIQHLVLATQIKR
ncbi:MAG: biopolymer transporter ExbD [Candidatus Omnitrophica bacterium]|nr:biopolymer transporter ExbD [Candidatus Omnitrophota bacterium]MDE2009609.1 biopolymer transporter ExbD [Candidatus Omnitrophota bacterium]MDE2214463.1 biopolymer transporter ExbD [Candidatus Omnitrophota bacterium]MDE2231603.1 biopolymer transporter ExbD [Candidatus Omnitrophota bacterium]